MGARSDDTDRAGGQKPGTTNVRELETLLAIRRGSLLVGRFATPGRIVRRRGSGTCRRAMLQTVTDLVH